MVYSDRMALFMNADGLKQGCSITWETIADDGVRCRVGGLTVLDYPISRGSVAGYDPEPNPLLPLEYHDKISGTPAAKSIPVRVIASREATNA